MAEILRRHSKLEILEAEDGMAIVNDVVYIPSSNDYMTIENDKLYLRPRLQESKNYNYVINVFLESLAREKGERSIAVFLSGDGLDGSVGASLVQWCRRVGTRTSACFLPKSYHASKRN